MNNAQNLANIYLNLYIKRENISYLSPLKIFTLKYLFKLINSISTDSVLIGVLNYGNDTRNIFYN
ncbi:hypothetical protein YYC_03321 [Plasmodium yoelii 17X]|uniref:Uncharacterized protein n=1 Tax=Plasmodium yoelii 17X TaxID=1323249 RepID=V7PHV8_PLAYE|nr:hypothetical protein YYC_03321 [Plasmodium yoelii 17X]